MIPQKGRQSDSHHHHHQGHSQLVCPSRIHILKNHDFRSLHCFTGQAIEERQILQSFRFYFFGKEQIRNVGSIKAHHHVVQQKHEEPTIVFFSVRVVRPTAEMVISRYDSVVFHSIVFAPWNFVQLGGLALRIGLEQEMIVWIMIIPTKGSARDNSRTAVVRHRPGAKTRQENEDANVCVYVRQPGALIEQPGIHLRKNNRPTSSDNREIRQDQYSA
mmetsp:Transcript_9119/g.22648  ORF Transcript_9119/g.22648 Transcript_9119/m.22648 type:complete len:217 (-) Transcript_9119:416-1066(-)